MGTNDPCLNCVLNTDFCIGRKLATWKKKDPPANRVKHIPISVIHRIAIVTQHLPHDSERLQATADMIIIAFFFFLRRGDT